jgi:predicted DCC family thiol-disulfide oxidoreductase YuxK
VSADDRSGPIVLYDGVCALCNRVVRFVLARDRAGMFRFASLQGEFASAALARHDRDPDALDTLVVVVDAGLPSERLLDRSGGVLFILERLGTGWPLAARVARLAPPFVRDWTYDWVARWRYRAFGRYEACPVPPPEHRAKFLE